MKAALWYARSDIRVEDVSDPGPPGPGDAVIRDCTNNHQSRSAPSASFPSRTGLAHLHNKDLHNKDFHNKERLVSCHSTST